MRNDDRILVFLSRPNPYLDNQQLFIDRLRSKLEESGLETITLQADNYDLTESINYLKGMIRQCYGIIVVGFNQIYIEKGVKKRGAIERPEFFDSKEIDVSGQSLTSPFCHIEGTIGLLNDLPLLIMNEKGVREEGIIRGGRFSVKTRDFDISNINAFWEDRTVCRQLSVWIGKVMDYYLFLNIKRS